MTVKAPPMMPPYPPNPLHLAGMAQNMARNAEGNDALVFQKVAMWSMGAIAVSTVAQVLFPAIERLRGILYPDNHADRISRERHSNHDRER